MLVTFPGAFEVGIFLQLELGSGKAMWLPGQEVTLAGHQRQSTGRSCIPGEGTQGFPREDGEAALRGFVFLFRPPGLATAADGDRLGPRRPCVPGLLTEV